MGQAKVKIPDLNMGGTPSSTTYLRGDGTWATITATGTITGTGASGQVSFWNGTTSITGESNLFWDSTNDRLGIGTETPVYRLDVNGGVTGGPAFRSYKQASADDGLNALFINTSATGYSSYIYIGSTPGVDWKIGKNITDPSVAVYNFQIADGNNNLGMQIDSSTKAVTFYNTVTASGGFFNSDIRLKDLTDYSYDVSDIKPISYLWKDSRDNKKHVGYSAQEVQKVMPDAVNEGEDGMLSVNYVEVLVAQVELLNNRITEMQKEIELLKSK